MLHHEVETRCWWLGRGTLWVGSDIVEVKTLEEGCSGLRCHRLLDRSRRTSTEKVHYIIGLRRCRRYCAIRGWRSQVKQVYSWLLLATILASSTTHEIESRRLGPRGTSSVPGWCRATAASKVKQILLRRLNRFRFNLLLCLGSFGRLCHWLVLSLPRGLFLLACLWLNEFLTVFITRLRFNLSIHLLLRFLFRRRFRIIIL